MQRRRGFTIVELLVVVGIIAVLVALLLPTVARMREAAKSVQCMSNLRQFGLSIQEYALDYRGVIPCTTSYANPSDGRSWYSMMTGEQTGPGGVSIKVGKKYIPKDADTTKEKGVRRNGYTFCPLQEASGYGLFRPQSSISRPYFVKSSQPDYDSFYGLRITVIDKPENFGLLFDTFNPANLPRITGSRDWWPDRWSYGYNIWMAHGGANGLFADFHVETCDGEKLRRTGNDRSGGTKGITHWFTKDFTRITATLP